MPPPPIFSPVVFIVELVFSLIAILFCFIIYYKTRESYQLTKYEGLRYFRDAFLFFGLSYVMRFLFSPLLFSRNTLELILPNNMFMLFFIFPLGYFSTVAIFYILHSSMWQKINHKGMVVTGHVVAVILPVIAFITRMPILLLYLQTIMLIIVVVLSFFAHNSPKKISNSKITYVLICLLWLINLWIINAGRPFPPLIQTGSQIMCLGVFVSIYYRISKWTK
jgi:hypothetical protein